MTDIVIIFFLYKVYILRKVKEGIFRSTQPFWIFR